MSSVECYVGILITFNKNNHVTSKHLVLIKNVLSNQQTQTANKTEIKFYQTSNETS